MSVHVADRTLPEEALGAMVEVARPGWRLREATLMDNGRGSIYRLAVDTDAGRRTCVLKTAPADPEPFDVASEARVQAVIARQDGVPAPDVLAVVDDHDDLRTPYYLMEAMPGDHLPADVNTTLSAERRRRFARELGRALGRLHDMDLDLGTYRGPVGYDQATTLDGESPSGDPGRLVVEDGNDTWEGALREVCEFELERLSDTRFEDLAPRFRAELARRSTTLPDPGPPVVGLADMHRENLLVDHDSGALTGVLDWEDAVTLPRGYSLAFPEWYFVGIAGVDLPTPHPDPLFKWAFDRDDLLAGYREATTAPAALGTQHPFYRLLFFLKDIVFIDGWTTDEWDVDPAIPLDGERADELAATYRAAAVDLLERDPT